MNANATIREGIFGEKPYTVHKNNIHLMRRTYKNRKLTQKGQDDNTSPDTGALIRHRSHDEYQKENVIG